MKTLLLLRHAKSSRDDPGLTDEERPLNNRGKREAPKVGVYLRQKKLLPDLVLCSTTVRARQTLKGVLEKSQYSGDILYQDDLYTDGPAAYYAALRLLPEEVKCVLIVAHNPDLEQAIQDLTGRHQLMPTAGLARVELPIEAWKDLKTEGSAKLAETWRPAQEE